MARTKSLDNGRDKFTITEQSKNFYVITETFPSGKTYTYHVQVTTKRLVLTDSSSAERRIAIQLLQLIGRKDLADQIRRGRYSSS
jgi:hypothetical protein